MNRRGFLSKAWFAPFALPTILLAEPLAPSDNPNYEYQWKGYFIRWTGWKCEVQSDDEVGQWIAVTKKEPYVRAYSSVPGGYGFYFPGYVFDIDVKRSLDWDQVRIVAKTPKQVREDEKAAGLSRLMRFLRDHEKEGR